MDTTDGAANGNKTTAKGIIEENYREVSDKENELLTPEKSYD
jgi:hypothetical protein